MSGDPSLTKFWRARGNVLDDPQVFSPSRGFAEEALSQPFACIFFISFNLNSPIKFEMILSNFVTNSPLPSPCLPHTYVAFFHGIQWLPKERNRFKRGMVSFAGGGKNTRGTEMFVAYSDTALGAAMHEVHMFCMKFH